MDQQRTCTAVERARLTGTRDAAGQRVWCQANGVKFFKRRLVDECSIQHDEKVSALLDGWADPAVGSWRSVVATVDHHPV